MSYTERSGFVLPFEEWTAGTYLLTSHLTVGSNNLILNCAAGDIYVKADDFSIIADSVGRVLVINSTVDRRVVFTSKNDDSRGAIIAGSTGLPRDYDQRYPFINVSSTTFTYLGDYHIDLSYVEFHYGLFDESAIYFSGVTDSGLSFRLDHIYFFNCGSYPDTFYSLIGCPYETPPPTIHDFQITNISVDSSNLASEEGGAIATPKVNYDSKISGVYVDSRIQGNQDLITTGVKDCNLLLENMYLYGLNCDFINVVQEGSAAVVVRSITFEHSLLNNTGTAINAVSYYAYGTIHIYNNVFIAFDDSPIITIEDITVSEFDNVFFEVDGAHKTIGGVPDYTVTSSIDGDPQLGSLPTDTVIDDECIFPDGHAVTNLDLVEYQGYLDYASFGYSSRLTPTGYFYDPTDVMTAGFLYLLKAATPPEIMTASIFIDEPNWLYPVSITQSFDTSIFISKLQKEQRRPLRNVPQRTTSFTIDRFTNRAELEIYLERYKNTRVVVPIYSEPILLIDTGNLSGHDTFTSQKDLSFLYNLLHNTSYVVLVDIARVIGAELLTLDFAIGTNIATTAATHAFTGEKTVMYPVMLAYLTSVQILDVTDDKISVQLTFVES